MELDIQFTISKADKPQPKKKLVITIYSQNPQVFLYDAYL